MIFQIGDLVSTNLPYYSGEIYKVTSIERKKWSDQDIANLECLTNGWIYPGKFWVQNLRFATPEEISNYIARKLLS